MENSTHTSVMIRNLNDSHNATEVLHFLGLWNALSTFSRNFACIADPLNSKLRNNQLWKFDFLSYKEKTVMKTLQKRMTSAPILLLSHSKSSIYSPYECLPQTSRFHIAPRTVRRATETSHFLAKISYKRNKFVKYDRSWMIHRLRSTPAPTLLPGRKPILRLYWHSARRWILILANAPGNLARCRLWLSRQAYDVVHRPGVEQQAAHALCQLETDELEDRPVKDDIPFLAIKQNEPVSPKEREDYFICSVCNGNVNELPITPIAPGYETSKNTNEPLAVQKFIEEQSENYASRTAVASIGMSGLQ